jgi:hypothetical protein
MSDEVIIQPTGLRHSESIAKLTAALAKAASEFSEIRKDCENPYYGNRYADLASLIAATRPALSKYELALIQIPQLNGSGAIITTLLSHSSGEWLASDLKLPASKVDAQGIGSAITYARRYSYQAILNIAAEEDDDGNAAVGKSQDRGRSTDENGETINPVQQRALTSACKTGGRTEQQLAAWLKNIGLERAEQLPQADFRQAVKWALNKNGPENLESELAGSVKAAEAKSVSRIAAQKVATA